MFDEELYRSCYEDVFYDITYGIRTPKQYMHKYKMMIETENYECAKAITEVLLTVGYHTKDTHRHIKRINNPSIPPYSYLKSLL